MEAVEITYLLQSYRAPVFEMPGLIDLTSVISIRNRACADQHEPEAVICAPSSFFQDADDLQPVSKRMHG